MAELTVYTSSLFDPKKKAFLSNISLTVDTSTGLIASIFQHDDVSSPLPDPLPENSIDLRGKFVMPGFVDAHTHIFLHSYDEASASDQKRDESVPERIIRAINHCRTALLAGYTVYRDLGSKGMGDADANIRDLIARGLIPGPRLFVATRPIASTDAFESNTENGHRLPAATETVENVEHIKRAVRRRVAAGADVIKVFADHKRRSIRALPDSKEQHPYTAGLLCLLKGLNPDYVLSSQEELDLIVSEARLARRPVAAHCCSLEGAMAAIKAGVRTIEHCNGVSKDGIMRAMAEKSVIMVPTLASAEKWQKHKFPSLLAQTKRAYDLGVRLACGGDAGTFSHGDNAREMELMVECGMPVEDVLESCMVGGWEACGGDLCGRRFGWFEEGAQADIIALETDPRVDKGALRKVDFVMKDAKVWKLNGTAIGMI